MGAHGRAIQFIQWWLCSTFLLQPIPRLHLSSECLSDLGWPRGEEEHQEHTYHQEPTSWRGTAKKRKEPAIPELRAVPKREKDPLEPTAASTGAEENASSLRNINPLKKIVFTSPRRLLYTPSHPTDTCTVSPIKVAPGAPPTMAHLAYHPYQMPMVQNSWPKAVENSDMLPPHFNG